MISIKLVYMTLLLMVTALECQPEETDSENIKIKPSRARAEVLGRSLLHLAPDQKVAERLIKEGADVNAQDNYDVTPLHCAAHTGSVDLVGLLIDQGAEVNTKDNEGRTPTDCAKNSGHIEIAELLCRHRAEE